MGQKYNVKIDDSILPQTFTFDQLIEAGLLDNFDDKIRVKLERDTVWNIAREFPFYEVESEVDSSVVTASNVGQSQAHASQPYTRSENNSVRSSQSYSNDYNRLEREDRSFGNTRNEQPSTPSIIGKWNWGAFCLSWIWAVCNGVYWPLILIVCPFIPYVGYIICFIINIYLGIKGNEMAWGNARRNGRSVSSFVSTQRTWNKVGKVLFLGSLLLSIIIVCFIMFFNLN